MQEEIIIFIFILAFILIIIFLLMYLIKIIFINQDFKFLDTDILKLENTDKQKLYLDYIKSEIDTIKQSIILYGTAFLLINFIYTPFIDDKYMPYFIKNYPYIVAVLFLIFLVIDIIKLRKKEIFLKKNYEKIINYKL